MNTKKFIALLTAVVLVLGITVIPVGAAPLPLPITNIYIENADVPVGEEVTVNIKGTAILTLYGFEITYDPTYVSFVTGSFSAMNNAKFKAGESNDGKVVFERTEISDAIYVDSIIASFKLKALNEIVNVSEAVTINIAPIAADLGGFYEDVLYYGEFDTDHEIDVDGDGVFDNDGDLAGSPVLSINRTITPGTITVRKPHTAPSITGVTITGDAKVGEVLTAVPAGFVDNYDAPAVYLYSWKAADLEVGTSATYTVAADNFGKTITVAVTPTVAASASITENLVGELKTSAATAAVTIDDAVKLSEASNLLTDIQINGNPSDLKAGKEYEVVYTNSVSAIDYSENLKLRLYLLDGIADECTVDNLVTTENTTVTVTGLKFKADKTVKGKYLKVFLVVDINDISEDVKEIEAKLIKASTVSSGGGGSTGHSLVPDKDKDGTEAEGNDGTETDDKDPGNNKGKDASKFTDIPEKTYGWAKDAIAKLTEDGVIVGTSDTTFEPAGEVTRAQFVAFLVRGAKLKSTKETRFTDVASNYWGLSEVSAADEAGIFDYIEGNKLNPDEVLTRDEMALIAYNAIEVLKIKLPELQSAVEFDDADAINPNAKDAVAALSKAGIILGNGDGTFAPKGTTIRAAAAKVVHMILVLK